MKFEVVSNSAKIVLVKFDSEAVSRPTTMTDRFDLEHRWVPIEN